jgi:hypothetical protein
MLQTNTISKNEKHISRPVHYSLKVFEIVKPKETEGKQSASQMLYAPSGSNRKG